MVIVNYSMSVLVVKCPMQTPWQMVLSQGKYFCSSAIMPFLNTEEVTFISWSQLYSYLWCSMACKSCSVWTVGGMPSPLLNEQKLQRVMGRGVDLRVAKGDWKSMRISISSQQLLQPTMIRSLYCVLSLILRCLSQRQTSRLLVPLKSRRKESKGLSLLLPMNRLMCRQLLEEQRSQRGPTLHPICKCSFSKSMFLGLRHCFLNLLLSSDCGKCF